MFVVALPQECVSGEYHLAPSLLLSCKVPEFMMPTPHLRVQWVSLLRENIYYKGESMRIQHHRKKRRSWKMRLQQRACAKKNIFKWFKTFDKKLFILSSECFFFFRECDKHVTIIILMVKYQLTKRVILMGISSISRAGGSVCVFVRPLPPSPES